MKRAPGYLDKHLVLAGGGHAHVQVLKDLMMNPIEGLQTTLVSTEPLAPYSGMLPGHLAGWYEADELHFDLRRLCEAAGARFVHAAVTGVDPDGKTVQVEGHPELDFTWCSVNTGIQPSLPPGVEMSGKVIPLKPISSLIQRWERFIDGLPSGGKVRVAMVGGGAAGVEVAWVLHMRLRELGLDPEVHLYQSGERLLPEHPKRAGRFFERLFFREGLDLHLNCRVERVDWKGTLDPGDGSQERFDAVFFATRARPASWFRQSGLRTDEAGFLEVGRTLESTSHPGIFGAGDCVHIAGYDHPKAGVYAVFGGRVLAHNLRAAVEGRDLKKYRPQRTALALITSGRKRALASKSPLVLEGPALWKCKDRIDRRFMERYSRIPPMAGGAPMLCGGCGSKVGPGLLQSVLGEVPFEDAAALGGDSDTLQSIDYLESLPLDPMLFGRVAALHAFNDLYACGARPEAAWVLAKCPHGRPDLVETNLRWLMEGVRHEAGRAGARIAGGHSLMGEGFGVGLSVAGRPEQTCLPKRGGRAGDRIILTQPLGSGAVFAALKRAAPKCGRAFEELQPHLLTSQAEASGAFVRHGAPACTDVSGFGLIGHLAEMLEGRELGAELECVPALSLALDLLASGIESSIAPPNERRFIEVCGRGPEGPRERILLDPQTAGGLMAFVEASRAERCLSELHEAGYAEAAVIGTLKPRAQGPRVWLQTC